MKDFIRYPKLWLSLAKNSLIRQTEFKANLIGRLSIEAVWIFSQVLFYKAAFRFVPDLAGWTEGQIWFFVGSLFFVDGLMMVFFHENHSNFGQLMRLGQFDFYLLYPASSLFLANFRFVNVVSAINLFVSAVVVIWASTLPDVHMTATSWMIWFVYMILGTALVGVLGILVCCLTFWITQSANLMWLFYEIYRLGSRPEGLYNTWLRRLICTVFPAAFFVSIPVQLVLGRLGGWWYAYPFILLTVLCFICARVWRRGVAIFEGAMS